MALGTFRELFDCCGAASQFWMWLLLSKVFFALFSSYICLLCLIFLNVLYIPFRELTPYKAEALGIQVVTTEESYTSKASALHRDFLPAYSKASTDTHTFSGKRVSRGLYKSEKGIVNADVNGAFNIIRKVVRDDLIQRIEGYSNPVSVAVL